MFTKLFTTKESFQFTSESWRQSSPFTVSRNWLPPAIALAGEVEVITVLAGRFRRTELRPARSQHRCESPFGCPCHRLAPAANWLTRSEVHGWDSSGSARLAEPHNSSARYQNYTADVKRQNRRKHSRVNVSEFSML